MIEIAFTYSNKWFSKTIRNITKEDISHVVIIIDNTWVLHSNLLGVQVQHIDHFLKSSFIRDRIKIDRDEKEVIATFAKYEGSGYDIGAMLFLGISIKMRATFPKFTPKQNLWQTTGMFLCTEFLSSIIEQKENGMLTPGQLRTNLKGLSNG